jgi:hypothetical protein
MNQTVKLTVPSIYVLVFQNEGRFLEIQEALDYQGWANEIVREFVSVGTGRLYAAVVVNGAGKPTHLCRLIRRQIAALDRRTVGISELQRLNSVDGALLEQAILAARAGRRRPVPMQSLERLTPSENKAVIENLNDSSPELADVLRKKGRADDRILANYTVQEREIIGLERDAVGLALEIAFDNRDQIAVDGATRKYNAFLSMLAAENVTEDELILHEKERFDGLTRLKGANPKVTDFEHNGSRLRVIHANRTRLEHTLGVDLIYVSEYFKSFVGVQYKMTRGASDDSHFVPDAGFKKQLSTMTNLWTKLESKPTTRQQLDYRLNNIPFYFKFVSRLETNFADDKLCPGMYLPCNLVSQLRQAEPPAMIGRKHGTRHLSNTEFANLVRHGWVGANAAQAGSIGELIETGLKNRRSVTIGIQRNAPVRW